VLAVASASLLLAHVTPGDELSGFDVDPAVVAARRRALGLDDPLSVQYLRWLGHAARLDLGESIKYPGRSVSSLIAERAGNSFLLGVSALIVATALGVPIGILSGSRRSSNLARIAQAATVVFLSMPPIVLSLGLLLFASRSGWFPVGGLPDDGTVAATVRHITLPVLALALPVAAALHRLQARAIADSLRDPSVVAAYARGVPRRRVIWRHAVKLALTPVLAVYGTMIGALISGSFVVEYVMTWPGLGRLMYDALLARDANLVAACAATGTAFLALGILATDIAMAVADPRREVLG
jgi:peptide/nickel transport system permease protein